MEIIPAIDIIEGKCVRLTQGDYFQKIIYNENPLEVAKEFEGVGIKRLHLVDLEGAKAGKIVNYKVLEKIASGTNLVIDFGGGIKTNEAIKVVFESGANMATIGSVAVKDPVLFESWIVNYGSAKLLLGADVQGENIAVAGWLESTNISIFDFLKHAVSIGVTQVFCTDIAKDGMLNGPSILLYKKIMQAFPQLQFIASGGVTNVGDLEELHTAGCSGVIIGKALYEGKIKFTDLKPWLQC